MEKEKYFLKHTEIFFLNFISLFVSFLFFNFLNIILFNIVWMRSFLGFKILYFGLMYFLFKLHIKIGDLYCDKYFSKLENIKLLKRRQEFLFFSFFYFVLYIGSYIGAKRLNNSIEQYFFHYFTVCFVSNFIVFLIYNKKYKSMLKFIETDKTDK